MRLEPLRPTRRRHTTRSAAERRAPRHGPDPHAGAPGTAAVAGTTDARGVAPAVAPTGSAHGAASAHLPAPDALHQVVRTTYDRRRLGALLASDHGHRPLRDLTQYDVRLPGEDPEHMADVVDAVRRDGIREPLLVRVRPNGEHVLLDGHHRAVAVLREHVAASVPVLEVTCPCTMGCAVMWRVLQTLHDRATADGWG